MLGTDGAWRALPRLPAFLGKLSIFKTLSSKHRGEESWISGGKRQAAPAAPWLRHGRMEHGRAGRGSNKESEKLMVRSRSKGDEGVKGDGQDARELILTGLIMSRLMGKE